MRLCPRTILSVEDSADEIYFLQSAFDQLGYVGRVHFARDGAEAVDYISGTGVYADRSRFPLPCVVITDLKMPLMDGFELIKWLREESPCKTLPAYVLTSSQVVSDRVKAQTCGASGYVQKPAVGQTLASALQQIESGWLPHLSTCTGNTPRLCD